MSHTTKDDGGGHSATTRVSRDHARPRRSRGARARAGDTNASSQYGGARSRRRDDSGGRGPGRRSGGRNGSKRGFNWKKLLSWRFLLAATAVGVVAVGVMIGIAYAMTDLPDEGKLQQTAEAQGSTISYANGSKIATIGTNRRPVQFQDIPPHVRDAVIALENRDFYSEPGISIRGMFRALWSTVSGEQVQGASTITQQYVRNYYDIEGISKDDISITRKLKEIFVSLKVDQELEKDEILTRYLNVIYFGRGAYGIEAAAQAYFKKSVKDLSVEQGAFLAGVIQNPTRGDIDKAHEEPNLKERFQTALGNMAETSGQYAKYAGAGVKVPKTVHRKTNNSLKGTRGYVVQQVLKELERDHGISEAEVSRRGMKIKTTINPTMMKYAKEAVEDTLKANGLKPSIVHGSLAAVNPRTGGIEAFYGGPGYLKVQLNTAFDAKKQAGSAWKPYVLAAWLDEGWSLDSYVDAPVKAEIEGNKPIYNSHRGQGYGAVNFTTMTAKSINTAYVNAWKELKDNGNGDPDAVAEIALKLGFDKKAVEKNKDLAIFAIGSTEVSAVQQAGGYAMFANRGQFIKPHLVQEAKLPDGRKRVSEEDYKPQAILDAEQAADATSAMQAVVNSGTGTRARISGRHVAGKTGTTDAAKETWFVGYTPQMSAASGLYAEKKTKNGQVREVKLDEIRSGLQGGSVSAMIWQSFMTKALENKPVEQFDPKANTGEKHDLTTRPEPKPTNPWEDWDDDNPFDPPGQDKKCEWYEDCDKPGNGNDPPETTDPYEPGTQEEPYPNEPNDGTDPGTQNGGAVRQESLSAARHEDY